MRGVAAGVHAVGVLTGIYSKDDLLATGVSMPRPSPFVWHLIPSNAVNTLLVRSGV